MTLFEWAAPSLTWNVLHICSPPIDDTPPTAGTLTAKWQPLQVLHISWDGFEEPQSRIDGYAVCVGFDAKTCDIQPWTDVGLSATTTLMNVDAPTGSRMYVQLRCTNTQGLSTGVTVPLRMSVGASSIDGLWVRHPVTERFFAMPRFYDSSDTLYLSSPVSDFRIQLDRVMEGVDITGMAWVVADTPAAETVPDDKWIPVGRFKQLKEDPTLPMEFTLDLNGGATPGAMPLPPNGLAFLSFRIMNSLNRDSYRTVPLFLDAAYPVAHSVEFVELTQTGWSTAASSLSLCWDAEFPGAPMHHYEVQITDLESGPVVPLVSYDGSVATDLAAAAETNYTAAIALSSCTVAMGLPLQDGHHYEATVIAVAQSGKRAFMTSNNVSVDTTLPACRAGFSANSLPVEVHQLYSSTDEENVYFSRTYVTSADSVKFMVGCEDMESDMQLVNIAITTKASAVHGGEIEESEHLVLPFTPLEPPLINDERHLQPVVFSDAGVVASLPRRQWLLGVVRAVNGAGTMAVGFAGAVMIDDTAPVLDASNVGIVGPGGHTVFATEEVVYQTNANQLQLSFDDAFLDPDSGISHYLLAYINYDTATGGNWNLLPGPVDALVVLAGEHQTVPSDQTMANITIQHDHDGAVYLAQVVAVNKAGSMTAVAAPRVMVDASPPIAQEVWVEGRYGDASCHSCQVFQADTNLIEVNWATPMSDPESGLKTYTLELVRLPHVTALGDTGATVGYKEVVTDPLRSSWVVAPEPGVLVDGAHYRVRVTAANRAGGKTVVYTNVVTVDVTPPWEVLATETGAAAVVRTAVNADTGKTQTFVPEAEAYTVTMDGSDNQSPVFAYIVSVGSSPGDTNVVDETAVCAGHGECGTFPDCTPNDAACSGSSSAFEVSEEDVADYKGLMLYSTVVALNQAGGATTRTTDGRLIDEDDPSVAAVLDGWGTDDASFVSVNDAQLYTSWLGAEDATTEIVERYVAVTASSSPPTSAGDYTAIPKHVGRHFSVDWASLQSGQRYYVHLRVVDKAGHEAFASSDGALMDFCAPQLEYIRHVIQDAGLQYQNTTQGTVVGNAVDIVAHTDTHAHNCIHHHHQLLQTWRFSGVSLTPKAASTLP